MIAPICCPVAASLNEFERFGTSVSTDATQRARVLETIGTEGELFAKRLRSPEAREARERLEKRYGNADPETADVVELPSSIPGTTAADNTCSAGNLRG